VTPNLCITTSIPMCGCVGVLGACDICEVEVGGGGGAGGGAATYCLVSVTYEIPH